MCFDVLFCLLFLKIVRRDTETWSVGFHQSCLDGIERNGKEALDGIERNVAEYDRKHSKTSERWRSAMQPFLGLVSKPFLFVQRGFWKYFILKSVARPLWEGNGVCEVRLSSVMGRYQ
jgi:hypothetical protein